MIVIWRGWGFIVLLFGFAAAALAAGIIDRGGIHSAPIVAALIDVIAGGLAALGIWAFTYRIDSQPGRVLIDKKTGREFTVRRSAGSLFFIKTRYWPYITVAIGVIFALRRIFNI